MTLMSPSESNLPSPFPRDCSLPEVRPTWHDARFSLASLAAALTACSVLLALITLAPPEFWLAAQQATLLLLLLLGLAAVVLVASLLFIGAVLASGFGVLALLRAVVFKSVSNG